MLIDAELKQWGNSYGIRITKQQAERLGLEKGAKVNIDVVKKELKSACGVLKGKKYTPFKRDRDDRF